MKFDRTRPLLIFMLGAGGTGGHIAPHLYRLIYALGRPAKIILADGDQVEEKNLLRQNFCRADLGKNKAQVLAERYGAAFGLEAAYVPDFVESAQQLYNHLRPRVICTEQGAVWEQVILLGAVDNNRSRALCDEVFYASSELVYIDSGNDKYRGQVVCGVRRNNKTVFAPLSADYPDLLKGKGKYPSQRSCAQAAVSAPQSMAANITAASIVVDMVYNIAARGELATRSATFSTVSVHVRPSGAMTRRKAA